MSTIPRAPKTVVSVEVVSQDVILINRHFKTTKRFFDMNREEALLVYQSLKEVFHNESVSESPEAHPQSSSMFPE